MVLLNDIVEVFALSQSREAPEFIGSLHVLHCARIGWVLVHCDRTWVDGMRLGQRLAEEPLRRSRIPLRRQQEVDRLAAAVDRAVEIGPGTLDLDVGLV